MRIKNYEMAKKAERKAKGADIAIERTKEKIRTAQNENITIQSKIAHSVVILRRRKVWYEKFHFTHTGDNFLVISGTDASINEKLVKRYLTDDDLFFHADIQGAAATILKSEGRNISEKAILRAATFAVSYSAAWNLNRPIADAYHVTFEQVSLTPPSGQFLPKGSFMIYGEKTFVKDIKLELTMGLIIERHWAKIIIGGNEIKDHCSVAWTILPGDIQRGKLVNMIKKKLLISVEEKDIIKIKAIDVGEIALMIPGNSKISDWHFTS